MPRIPESFVREVIDRNPIEELISGYVELKRSSGNYVGLCPFHSEKTPSFTVFPDTHSFYCFGCGAGGDAVSFVSKIENLAYPEAVKFLAQKASMSMPEDGSADDATARLRDMILRANREAARFYHACLKEKTLGAAARAYIEKRKLTPETVTHFGLGAAPDSWDALTKHLVSKGFSESELVTAGLARKGKNGGCYDFFRNRLIFPIIDLRGNVIAFGGRVFDNSQPKYLNSSDTPVFSKKNNLFALNFAKNRGNGRLVLAEGYMDVISMHQAGFTEAVATLGTAITPEQSRLMSRYAKKIIIAYDTDEAGQNAVKKASRLLGELNVDISILAVSEGKDPDEFIRENGAERFELLLNGARSRLDYELGIIKSKHDLSLADGKIAYIRAAAEAIAREPYAVTREVYAGVIAAETGVTAEQIKRDVARILKSSERKKGFEVQNDAEKRLHVPESYGDKSLEMRTVRAEEGIIAELLRSPDYLSLLPESPEKLFVTEKNAALFLAVKGHIENGEGLEIYSFSGELEPEETSRLAGIEARGRLSLRFTPDEIKELAGVLAGEKERREAAPVTEISDDDFRRLIKKK